MKYSFVYDGILHIHVDTIEELKAEMKADKTREMPCIIWYDDGLPQGMVVYWSQRLTDQILAANRGA